MNNNLSTVNDYSILPIPLDVAKSFLRITGSDDDALITILLKSAINFAEQKFAITIGKKEYQYQIYGANCDISLPRSFTTVTSVKVAGVDAQYEMVDNRVRVKQETNSRVVEIRFICENYHFGEAMTVAILRHTFFLYENRSNITVDQNEIESIYQPLIMNNYNIIHKDIVINGKYHGWLIICPVNNKPIIANSKYILFLLGNAGNISYRMNYIIQLNKIGFNILIIDYP